MKPFLKWAGGKRQLIPQINRKIDLIRGRYNSYFEPFVGAGAILFDLKPSKAYINDINADLINVYIQIRENPLELIKLLESYKRNHSKDLFYKVRNLDREKKWEKIDNLHKAARTIYLNKTCYNGLFRVNLNGKFNVPYGTYKNPNIVDKDTILSVSKYLGENNITIMNCDFEDICKNAKKGDFVYFDPPYDVVSETSSFTKYTKDGFTRNEQIRLKKLVDKLTKKGIYVLLSNAATPFIMELYEEYEPFTKIVKANRNINSKGDKRGKIEEVLIDNFEKIDSK